MKAKDKVKRDNLLVEFLLNHKGQENAVNRYDIADFLTSKGFLQSASTVHGVIAKIIEERHLPICSLNGKGYFWAKSKDDILVSIAELESRIEALKEHISFLENFIIY